MPFIQVNELIFCYIVRSLILLDIISLRYYQSPILLLDVITVWRVFAEIGSGVGRRRNAHCAVGPPRLAEGRDLWPTSAEQT